MSEPVLRCRLIMFGPVRAGLLVNRYLHRYATWAARWLPGVAMWGICGVIASTIALSRDDLIAVAVPLPGAAVCHNATGYILGYWSACAFGLGRIDSRTVSIEVGMQYGEWRPAWHSTCCRAEWLLCPRPSRILGRLSQARDLLPIGADRTDLSRGLPRLLGDKPLSLRLADRLGSTKPLACSITSKARILVSQESGRASNLLNTVSESYSFDHLFRLLRPVQPAPFLPG